MANRFGRRQKRRLLERLHEAEGSLWLAEDAVINTRCWADEGLGFNCTFVDDDMRVIVGLAQRAVLAGLASDFKPDMQRRFKEAAEKHREAHERALGRQL